MDKILEKLSRHEKITRDEIIYIYKNISDEDLLKLMKIAKTIRMKEYDRNVFIRGLIEISSFCKRDCKYCGINCLNDKAERFRLNKEDILSCCRTGYAMGFRTFVLQGGEDSYFTDEIIVNIIRQIKEEFEDVAITLSLGEKTYETYEKFYKAGADRYLLRHETINRELFEEIHKTSTYSRRIESLYELKEIGYAVGAGFMVGIPGQSYGDIADDILFLEELQPEMVGIGPFLSHKDTVYRNEKNGSLRDTLISIALVRIFIPDILLPATTALSTMDPQGRKMGLDAGANVIMPNLSPKDNIDKYSLYNDKLNTGIESAEHIEYIRKDIEKMGYYIVYERGDNVRRMNSDKR